jgi:hypothetical protein
MSLNMRYYFCSNRIKQYTTSRKVSLPHEANLPNPSSRTMVLSLSQLLTEMNGRKSFCGGYKARPARQTDLTAVKRLSTKCFSTSQNLIGLNDLLQGYLYFFFFFLYILYVDIQAGTGHFGHPWFTF